MVKKYIDTEMLIAELDASCMPIFEKGISGILGDEESIADVIRSQPAADVQEVTRCKNCKYINADTFDQKAVYFCTQNVFAKRRVKLNDFCSYGARMDGEENGKN